ncbi:NAD(P)-binding domain-containing protein [Candidatus Nitrosocosmicus arcticus]|uniref:UDP-N-acetyl-D-mannosamine dehydrogenase n=1 Tax=Candidatus Nitrosocosmicus arcticus TaxID=2035267 RepID=A0A557SR57_9ARCH|nr:NAD(P)-binding domain-containing protein [Candidatus Nitrosocosmicus arcticus]TVP39089.1 UDP-glucose/GDP-mannose family dehydrogenase [Candidatus Nitrosocosmicus arcticus]
MIPLRRENDNALDDMRLETQEQYKYPDSIPSPSNTFTSNKLNDQRFNALKNEKVVIIGLGQLGLPVAKYVKEHGFDTYGYDINQKTMQSAESKYGIKQATNFGDFDVLIICVSTHRPDDMFTPQVDGLMSVVEKISREAKAGALISIESTIPKGTSKKVFEKVDHKFHVVHAPHRWYALEEEVHGVNQLRIVGGVSNCCLQHGLNFYDGREVISQTTATASGIKSLSIPMHPVSSVEVAELTKIVENAHRYLQIAFAEELYLYCKSNSISFSELRESLNTKWNVEVLEPRDGIGGHCLPKDTKMFINSSNTIKSKILQAAVEIDEDYREYRSKLEKEVKIPAV